MLFDLPVMLVIVLFLALGIFSQWLANRIKWPSIVVMSIVGLLVGPILGLANPEQTLGSEIFSPIVSLAVAIILFEGSSNLDFRELKGISKAVIRIITIGATIAWVLGAIALHKILGFPISIAIVMGGLLLITGPTVIQPLLKQAKVRNSVDTVLRWESIILDPLGPILALAAFYVYQIVGQGFGFQLLLIFIFKMLIVALIGFGASFFFNWLIQRDVIPQNLMPSIQLVFILLVFSICDQILDESGLLAVTIFGLMMARYKRHDLIYKESDHFIENMSSILVSTVFILITSSLTPSVLMNVLSWKLVIFSLVMIVLVRPIAVLLSTIGTEITKKERALVAMMAPRGIVVLTVAQFFGGLFLNDNMKMASYITPVTFGLVFITVVIYGFSFTPISKMLGLASTEPPGVILVGESEFSYHLGRQLQSHGIPVMVFNLFSNTSDKAEELGFEIFKGNLLSSSDRMYADLIRYNKCLLMTKSFIFNSLAFNELVPEFGLNNVNMMPVSFTDDQARNNLNGPLRNHILFDEKHSPRWFDNVITNQNIVEVPASSYHDITDKDMIIYHINDDKEATFHRSTKSMDEYDNGTYGILRNVYK
ncbi:sodium:proton antiporter [Staphylococcus hominis]|uniref:cation:proton antiporter n=1 Tax=Staphylococcus hominis TaxID=1290 RepID=UPI000CD1CAFF|nr:sodium:proton antiporter [Staphylococcus hominis]AYY66547.1 sodium:proton antiporter [Staphylococcus hominis]MCT1483683.1 sodium:proton antiporter [Staphylococcus hominis]MDT4036209.1 sodium:proton antiporter [Staphylococcus hominis]PNZ31142.1 sodium:proton antiporter [Staphylococcus hominis subsp. hominis]WRY66143.1 sodium:proton antiporter [Staphylococcus hominis]